MMIRRCFLSFLLPRSLFYHLDDSKDWLLKAVEDDDDDDGVLNRKLNLDVLDNTAEKAVLSFDSNFCTNEEEEERPILGQAGKQAQSNQQQKRYTEAKKKSRRSSIVQTHTKHTRHKHRD